MEVLTISKSALYASPSLGLSLSIVCLYSGRGLGVELYFSARSAMLEWYDRLTKEKFDVVLS